MTLTKEEWFKKLKSWVPHWYFENPEIQQAIFYAVAEVLSKAQLEVQDNVDQTFLTLADGSYLDLHGSERSVDRITGELDPSYSTRIRNFSNYSNKHSIKSLVDALLINGECQIAEDFDSGLFLNQGVYLNRGQLLTELIVSAFTIVLENQVHSPYSFLDREHFMNREDFTGTLETPDSLFDAIIAAVDKVKAFGVLYRVYERAEE